VLKLASRKLLLSRPRKKWSASANKPVTRQPASASARSRTVLPVHQAPSVLANKLSASANKPVTWQPARASARYRTVSPVHPARPVVRPARNFMTSPYTGILNVRTTLQELAFTRFTDVTADGNCGFYVAIVYLQQKGLLSPCGINKSLVDKFRQDLWQYAVDNLHLLMARRKYFDLEYNLDSLSNEGKQSLLMVHVNRIWQQGQPSFDREDATEPIACMKLSHSLSSLSSTRLTSCSLMMIVIGSQHGLQHGTFMMALPRTSNVKFLWDELCCQILVTTLVATPCIACL
jgi:hypothetical protein